METKKIKNLVFDFGGILVGLDKHRCIAALDSIGAYEISVYVDECRQEDLFHDLEMGHISVPEFCDEVRRKSPQCHATNEQIAWAWGELLTGIPLHKLKMLENLKQHYRLFLLSNTNVIHYDLYIRDLQLRFGYNEFDELFHKSYFSFAEHLEKPDPRFFELILDHEGLLPEETLFIDDTEKNIKIAQSLGINTYHISREELVRNLFENGVLKDGVV